MALYTVSAGGAIQAADLNQVVNLLAGTTAGEQVTLAFDATTWDSTGSGLKLQRTAAATQTQALSFAGGLGGDTLLGRKANDDTLYVSYWTGGTPTDLLKVSTAGDVTATRNLVAGNNAQAANAVFAGAGSYQCVEAANTNRNHLECLTPAGSDSVANGSGVTKTLSFARAFAFAPAVAAECNITGSSKHKSTALDSVSTSSATVSYWNHDGATQTLSNYTIIAYGA